MSALAVVGVSHRTAPIAVREALAFPAELHPAMLLDLQQATGAAELVLLSTCNRTEIYLRAESGAIDAAEQWLRGQACARGRDVSAHLFRLHGSEAARHGFRVACGLDSMSLGETQVLGQLKRAVREAAQAGTLGGTLDRLFQQAFRVAKEVRSRTAIGASTVSAVAASVKIARQLFGDLSRTRVLFVGAGEMIGHAAMHFAAQAPLAMSVANRTPERGEALARRIGAEAMALASLPAAIHTFDIVVSCTASTLPVIGKGMIETALRLRRRRPMFLVDLAVPRDIESEVGQLDDVFLQTLDSLAALAHEGVRQREEEAVRAEAIVTARAARFAEWLRARAQVPLIRRVRMRAQHDCEIELAAARKRLARGEDPTAVLEAFAHGLTNKLLHPAMVALGDAGAQPAAAALELAYGEPSPARRRRPGPAG